MENTVDITSDRPLDRLYLLRPQELSDSELLAILIGSGGDAFKGVTLASEVLKAADYRLSNLCKFTVGDLMRIPGIGRAKAGAIIAFAELSRRRQAEQAI